MTDRFNNLEVNIKTYHGNYVQAYLEDDEYIKLTNNNPKSWETFRIIDVGNGEIGFKCVNGKYISAKWGNDNYGLVLSNNIKSWEKFKIISDGNQWNIYSPHHNRYICAYDNGHEIRANAKIARNWEKFDIKIVTKTDEFANLNTSISKLCNTTQQIDHELVSQNPNIHCGISDKKWIYIGGGYKIKPIFAYLRYIQTKTIPEKVETTYEFTKEKGIERSWGISLEISQKISAKFEICESETEIKLGFNYSEKITEKTTEIWTEKVTGPATFYIYQPCVVYSVFNEKPYETKLIHLFRNSPFTTTKYLELITSNQAEWIIAKNKNIYGKLMHYV